MNKLLKGRISITRVTGGDSDGYVSLVITDDNSRVQFVSLQMNFEDFGKLLLGQGHMPTEFEVRGLNRVGMIRETKDLVFQLKGKNNSKAEAEATCHKYADAGWIASEHFSSQGSIRYEGNKTFAHGSQYRFVKAEDA